MCKYLTYPIPLPECYTKIGAYGTTESLPITVLVVGLFFFGKIFEKKVDTQRKRCYTEIKKATETLQNKEEFEMNIQNLIDTSMTVTSDWLKEHMPTTYEGIMICAEGYADDEANAFSHDELNEWKEEGFFCHIGLYEGMKEGSFETHTTPYGLNDSPAHDPWFVDNLDVYSTDEREILLAKLGE